MRDETIELGRRRIIKVSQEYFWGNETTTTTVVENDKSSSQNENCIKTQTIAKWNRLSTIKQEGKKVKIILKCENIGGWDPGELLWNWNGVNVEWESARVGIASEFSTLVYFSPKQQFQYHVHEKWHVEFILNEKKNTFFFTQLSTERNQYSWRCIEMHSIFPFMFVCVYVCEGGFISVEKFSGFLKHENFLLPLFFIPIILYTQHTSERDRGKHERRRERERERKRKMERNRGGVQVRSNRAIRHSDIDCLCIHIYLNVFV